MIQKKNKLELKSEQKKKYLDEIINFYTTERDEDIGIIGAETILDFFLETIGDEIYRKGVNDSKEIINERLKDIEIELDILTSE